jgi:hypothetical protein
VFIKELVNGISQTPIFLKCISERCRKLKNDHCKSGSMSFEWSKELSPESRPIQE